MTPERQTGRRRTRGERHRPQLPSPSLGGSLGLAAFNSVFHAKLVSELSGLDAEQRKTAQQPERVHQLTGALRETVLHAYDAAVDRVFLVAAGILTVALALALLLKLPDRPNVPAKTTLTAPE